MNFTISGMWNTIFFFVRTRTKYLWNFGYERERSDSSYSIFFKKSFLSDFGDNANTFSALTSTVLLCFLHLLGHAGNLCYGQALCSARETTPPQQMGWWGWLCSAVRNPGRRVVGRFADSPSRTMRDSVWNPLRERSCVSRILSCYILGTKGRGLERTGGREWSNQRFKMGLDSGRDLGQEVSQDGL